MKQIYICNIDDEKIEFLQGDHRTSTTTFYFDNDIKSKCFEILTKLNTLHNGLDFVNIYYKDSKIYVISEGDENYLSIKITSTNNRYALKL